MKNIIFLVNTYFQLIVAINLKYTKLKNDNVDIILSNHSSNSENVYNSLANEKIFRNVYYIKSRKKYSNPISKSLDYIRMIVCPLKYVNEMKNFNENKYDYMYFYNIAVDTYYIFDSLRLYNKNIKLIRFDEGIISYIEWNDCTPKIYRLLRRLLLKESMDSYIQSYLLFNPELIKFNCNIELNQIEKLSKDNNSIIDCLNRVFEYKKTSEFDKDFIFFEESFSNGNIPTEDVNLVLKIADVVGYENFLIKLHPRNTINRFEKYNIEVNKTIGIPWEVIQMNNNFSGKKLITISSGSILTSKLYFEEDVKIFYLYNCTESKSPMYTDEFVSYITDIKNMYDDNSFVIPDDKEELIKILKEEKNESSSSSTNEIK